MKKIISLIFALLICFNVCAKENKYILELKEIPLQSEDGKFLSYVYKDCIIDKSGNGDELYGLDGRLKLASGGRMRYISSENGSFIVSEDSMRYSSESEFYKRYYEEDIYKYGVRPMWNIYKDSVTVRRTWVATCDGEIISVKEPADVICDGATVYMRNAGREYRKLDLKSGTLTDVPYYASRMKIEKKNEKYNILDTHINEYIFKGYSDICDYLFYRDEYYFICGSKGNVRIFKAEDTAEKLVLKPFKDNSFKSIIPHLLSCYTGFDSVSNILIFECDGKYFLSGGGEITKEEFLVYSEGSQAEQMSAVIEAKCGKGIKTGFDENEGYYLEINGNKVTEEFNSPFSALSSDFVATGEKGMNGKNVYHIFDTEGNAVLENVEFTNCIAVENRIIGICDGVIKEYTVREAL